MIVTDLGYSHLGKRVTVKQHHRTVEGILTRVEHRAILVQSPWLCSATPDTIIGRCETSLTVGDVDLDGLNADTVESIEVTP